MEKEIKIYVDDKEHLLRIVEFFGKDNINISSEGIEKLKKIKTDEDKVKSTQEENIRLFDWKKEGGSLAEDENIVEAEETKEEVQSVVEPIKEELEYELQEPVKDVNLEDTIISVPLVDGEMKVQEETKPELNVAAPVYDMPVQEEIAPEVKPVEPVAEPYSQRSSFSSSITPNTYNTPSVMLSSEPYKKLLSEATPGSAYEGVLQTGIALLDEKIAEIDEEKAHLDEINEQVKQKSEERDLAINNNDLIRKNSIKLNIDLAPITNLSDNAYLEDYNDVLKEINETRQRIPQILESSALEVEKLTGELKELKESDLVEVKNYLKKAEQQYHEIERTLKYEIDGAKDLDAKEAINREQKAKAEENYEKNLNDIKIKKASLSFLKEEPVAVVRKTESYDNNVKKAESAIQAIDEYNDTKDKTFDFDNLRERMVKAFDGEIDMPRIPR